MNIVIVGAGGQGKVVLDILRLMGGDEVVGFIDADVGRMGTEVGGLPVLGAVNLLPRLLRQDVRGAIIAIGDNRVRLSYAQMVVQQGMCLVNAVHPSAVISPSAKLGTNVVVSAGAIIMPEAQIGDSAIVNTAAVVDHECQIGAGVHLCPGTLLAGRVTVEEGAFVGLGAKVLPCLRVGAYATIGAGAVILEDVPAGATVVGVPGRIVKTSSTK